MSRSVASAPDTGAPGRTMASREPRSRLAEKGARRHGGHDPRWLSELQCSPRPDVRASCGEEVPGRRAVHPYATPGQAGLPAEFKHINKRRKRN